VTLFGPPSLSSKNCVNACSEPIVVMMTTKVVTGRNCGHVMYQNSRHGPQPSTRAASPYSSEMTASPPRNTMVVKPTSCHRL
jgi:hypothetical protein